MSGAAAKPGPGVPIRIALLDRLRAIAGSRTGTITGLARADLGRDIGVEEAQVRDAIYQLTAAGCLRLITKARDPGRLGTYRLTGSAPASRARGPALPPRRDDDGARLKAEFGIEVTARPRLTGGAISLPRVRFVEEAGR